MEKNNWSKADLAKKLNTSKSFITQLFYGDKLINLKTLAKIQQISNFKFRIAIQENIKRTNNLFLKQKDRKFKKIA
jgi:ribosome-binding protein aMBF1 (putative translation factor)